MAVPPVSIAKIKGEPVTLFSNPGYGAISAPDKLSDVSVDCRAFNAVSVTIYIPDGFTVSATVKGSPDQQGVFLTLPDAQATQTALTASKVFDCTVGQSFVKILLSGITVPGGNPPNNGIVVIVTPYDAAGQSNISITATASQNLTEVGGSAVALGQHPMADSLPVVLPSDQTVPVSGTLTIGTQAALVAGEAHIGAVGGATVPATGSITRPANTTAYAAGEVVGTAATDVITIANAARKNGGSGVVLDVEVIDQGGAAAAGTFELYLFSASPTVQADQVALALVAADLANLVAVVPLSTSYVTNTAATISGSRAYNASGVNAGFQCAGGSTSLYGVLVSRAAYTPISAEEFTVIAKCSQD